MLHPRALPRWSFDLKPLLRDLQPLNTTNSRIDGVVEVISFLLHEVVHSLDAIASVAPVSTLVLHTQLIWTMNNNDINGQSLWIYLCKSPTLYLTKSLQDLFHYV